MRGPLPTLTLAVALAALACGAHAQRISLVDRIVAVVNKEVITQSELNEAIAAAERQLKRQGTPPPPANLLERQLLERLILDKAQLQLARDTGIRVDELQVDRAVQRIADSNKITLAQLRQALERDGISFDAWRRDIREQLTLSRVREREVDDKIEVNDREIDLFLEEMKARPDEKEEYNAAHILVRVPEQASPERIETARGRAEKAAAELAGGGDFGRVAASYSDAPDALQGGQLGWRAHDRLPELYAATLAKLRPGEVSAVLRSPAGFHVLKLIERRGAVPGNAPVIQTRMRHILLRTGESLSESEARRRLLDIRGRVLSGAADFGDMARQQSEDGTAARGGELDWVYPGDTVPEFERAYQNLKVGEISQPVRTPFGYHLVQVLERRSADLSPERKRNQARQILRDRKADDAYQEWLRQLRDQTYVELRLEDR